MQRIGELMPVKKSLGYDAERREFFLNGTPVSVYAVRAWHAQGRVAWVSPAAMQWFDEAFGRLPPPRIDPRAKFRSGVSLLVAGGMILAFAAFVMISGVVSVYGSVSTFMTSGENGMCFISLIVLGLPLVLLGARQLISWRRELDGVR